MKITVETEIAAPVERDLASVEHAGRHQAMECCVG